MRWRRVALAVVLGACALAPTGQAALPRGFAGLYDEDAAGLGDQVRLGSRGRRPPPPGAPRGPSARGSVRLLRAAYPAIKRADANAEVVAAGLPNSNLGVPFLRYLAGMYRAGAAHWFDTLAIHPYSADVQGVLRLVEQARVSM